MAGTYIEGIMKFTKRMLCTKDIVGKSFLVDIEDINCSLCFPRFSFGKGSNWDGTLGFCYSLCESHFWLIGL